MSSLHSPAPKSADAGDAMILTIAQLQQIAAAGGGLILETSRYTYKQMTEIVLAAAAGNTPVTLRGVAGLTADQLRQLATKAPGLIVFDFTG
jgi:hypothetical protein